MRRLTGTIVVALAVVVPLTAAAGQSDLAEVRSATARYQRLEAALDAGYVPFSLEGTDVPTCFDSPTGGMGVHYVRNIDATIDAADPEALVYELEPNGRQRLVGVEYIIPADLVDPANPPELFGHEFHPHSFLPVWILHAWVWKHNPDGMLADFNPTVGQCP